MLVLVERINCPASNSVSDEHREMFEPEHKDITCLKCSKGGMPKVSEEKPKSVCIAFATGCPRSKMDTAWLFPYFQANGWNVVDRAEDADLVVAVGCGFDAAVEEKSVRYFALLNEKLRNGAQLIVAGCLAGIDPARVVNEFGAKTIPPTAIEELDRVILATVPLCEVPPINDVRSYIGAARRCWGFRERHPNAHKLTALRHESRQFVRSVLRRLRVEEPVVSVIRRWRRIRGEQPIFRIRVARGCLEECTYCAIRIAAGTLRSKPPDKVLAEFDWGLSQGYKLFELVAEDLGPYGLDMGTTLPALLEALFSREGEFRVIFTDINIRYVIKYADELTSLLAANSERIQRLKVPVQSGSDKILALMRRCYTSAEAKRSLTQLLGASPSIPLETHVLVGFPGETKEDFMATAGLLKAVEFARIQVYVYTDRPGTLACEIAHKVPDAVKADRARRLLSEFPQSVYCSVSSPRLSTVSNGSDSPESRFVLNSSAKPI